MWHFYGKLVNCLPLSFQHPSRIFLSNGKHPGSVLCQTALWDCLGRYRFFHWLLRSCAGNWFGVAPNQHHGIVVAMLSLLLSPLKRLPQRLSLKYNLQMAKTERSVKGIDEHISPQKICLKSDQHQFSPNINMH